MLQFIREYHRIHLSAWKVVTFLIACNYFAFRVELCEDEYEDNHPAIDPFTHTYALSLPTINWETFDKDNAPKAITILPLLSLTLLRTLPDHSLPSPVTIYKQQIIRDKSPPYQA